MNKHLKSIAFALSGAFALAGCVSPVAGPSGLYARPIGNAPVTANPTSYSKKLECMAQFGRAQGFRAPRIAVGRILDYTGKADGEGGRRVTQGGSLMAMSAFAKAGAHLVERFDTAVTELELKYANNQLIGGGRGISQVPRGAIAGSDFYLVGGITELNYNIRSTGFDAFGSDQVQTDSDRAFTGAAGLKMYVINVALDLRLVDTKSLDVVDVISYQKQIIGRELSAGVFDFLNGNIFDISAGTRAQEPIQLAIRATIERAVLELVANMYGAPGLDQCGAGHVKRGPAGYPLQAVSQQYYAGTPQQSGYAQGATAIPSQHYAQSQSYTVPVGVVRPASTGVTGGHVHAVTGQTYTTTTTTPIFQQGQVVQPYNQGY